MQDNTARYPPPILCAALLFWPGEWNEGNLFSANRTKEADPLPYVNQVDRKWRDVEL